MHKMEVVVSCDSRGGPGPISGPTAVILHHLWWMVGEKLELGQQQVL